MDMYPEPLTNGWYNHDQSGKQLFGGWWLPMGAASYGVYVSKDAPVTDLSVTEADAYLIGTTGDVTYAFEPNSIYHIGVSAINACGGLESATADWFIIETDETGAIIGTRPYDPQNVTVTALVSGDIQVDWEYPAYLSAAAPVSFSVRELVTPDATSTELTTTTYAFGKPSYRVTVTPTLASGYIRVNAVSTDGVLNATPQLGFFRADAATPTGTTYGAVE